MKSRISSESLSNISIMLDNLLLHSTGTKRPFVLCFAEAVDDEECIHVFSNMSSDLVLDMLQEANERILEKGEPDDVSSASRTN